MKVLILAGGLGTRLSEETNLKPKPMVEIGGKPILWHIMKLYSSYGFNEFVILLGYKGYVIKEYFANYVLHQSNVTIDLKKNQIEYHEKNVDPWKVTLLETGDGSMTGGRVKRAKDIVGSESFMLTYGDGVSNVNIKELVEFHQKHGKTITLTSVQPEGRYGAISINEKEQILEFVEKPKGDNAWVNGGFFVCEPEVMNYIDGDEISFEKEPLEKMAQEGKVMAFRHRGFWKAMDSLRDKTVLEQMWKSNKAKWKIWKD